MSVSCVPRIWLCCLSKRQYWRVLTFLHRFVSPRIAMNNQTSVRGSGKNYKLLTFMIYNFHHYVQINGNGICCAKEQGEGEMCLYGFSKHPKWQEPLGRPRLRQNDNIKMCLKSVKAADCIHLARHRDQRSIIMFHKTQTISWLAEQRSVVRHLLPTDTIHVVLPG